MSPTLIQYIIIPSLSLYVQVPTTHQSYLDAPLPPRLLNTLFHTWNVVRFSTVYIPSFGLSHPVSNLHILQFMFSVIHFYKFWQPNLTNQPFVQHTEKFAIRKPPHILPLILIFPRFLATTNLKLFIHFCRVQNSIQFEYYSQ